MESREQGAQGEQEMNRITKKRSPMLYPEQIDGTLRAECFAKPPMEYRGAPFWSWNCHVTEELVREQIPLFQEMGMGAVTAHPRVGLDLEYMGEEFLERVRDTCRIAKEHGMRVVLYDEDNFPSGNAGGLVTIHPEYRSRYLRLTRKQLPLADRGRGEDAASGFLPGYAENRAAYEACLQEGAEPEGYYLGSYRIRLCEGLLQSYSWLPVGEDKAGRSAALDIARTAAAAESGDINTDDQETEAVWQLYLCVDPWREEAIPYVDTMNPKAVREFIRVTHERYEQALGEAFGTTAFAIFTDEPRLHNRNLLPSPDYEGDTTLAFTDDFSETFSKVYGSSFFEVLPYVVWETKREEGRWARLAYQDHLTERFAEAYSDQIGAWCEEHGILSTGHLLSERTLFQQTYRLGEAMRHYRSYQVPGIDILCGDPEYSTAKQAVSVARQYGREGVTSELYGVTNWNYSFADYKLQGDWQAALGITLRVPHLAYMSMAGEGKRDWPGSIFYQSPWYQKFAWLEEHFARVNLALTRGKARVRIAMIHPIETYWMYFGTNEKTQGMRRQLDEDFEDMIRWLLYDTLDFDFLCEALLPQQGAQVTHSAAKKGSQAVLAVGEMQYEAVVVPQLQTLRSSTLRLLEQFAACGGTVLFAGELPFLVDGRPSSEPKKLAESCSWIPFQRYALLRALEPFRDVRVETPQGTPTEDLFLQLREDGTNRWLFLCHTRQKETPPDRPEVRRLVLRGSWKPICYDTLTGEIRPLEAEQSDGNTRLLVTLYAQDSLLLQLQPGEPTVRASAAFSGEFRIVPLQEGEQRNRMPLSVLTEVCLQEPNVLLLDTPAYRFDQREWNAPMNCLKIEEEFHRRLHLSRTQPYRQKNAAPAGRLQLRYELLSETDSAALREAAENGAWHLADTRLTEGMRKGGLRLAWEPCEGAVIRWNGQSVKQEEAAPYFVDRFLRTISLPPLKKGVNVLEISYPFGGKSMVEPCYLLGNFAVQQAGAAHRLTAPPTVLGYGDLTRQGYPFYTGNINYTHRFVLDEPGEWELEVPFPNAPVLETFLDGEAKGLLALAPYRLPLGQLTEGGHRITVTAYGNRYNGFAPLHNADPHYKWYGPDSFRTSGYQWTEGYRIVPTGILDHPWLVPKEPKPW